MSVAGTVVLVRVGEDAVAVWVGVGVEAGVEISIAAIFHWSFVGAVSDTVTGVPAAWSVVSDWLQNVSPELARNWWSSV